jgi:hypothetical protein
MHRRLPENLNNGIKTQSASGDALKQIISSIRQSDEHPITVEDVYNIRKELCLENLAGKTPIEALINRLQTGQYKFNYQTDSLGRITHLFWAHPKRIEIFARFPEILLLNCTYKTNRYKMPLFDIIGTTCLNEVFYIEVCFMAKEEEEDYAWALEELRQLMLENIKPKVIGTDRDLALINAIKRVFLESKQIFCFWHIEKNVLVHASTTFKEEENRKRFMKAWVELNDSAISKIYEE